MFEYRVLGADLVYKYTNRDTLEELDMHMFAYRVLEAREVYKFACLHTDL